MSTNPDDVSPDGRTNSGFSGAESMQRVTFRAPPKLVEDVEAAVDAGRFPNRSEAIRAALRGRFTMVTDGGVRDGDN